MTIRGTADDDVTQRLRVGLVVLMVGVLVLLAAVGMAILRGPGPTGEGIATTPAAPSAGGDKLSAEQAVSFVPVLGIMAGLLVVTLLVSSYALFRLTRRLAVPPSPVPKRQPTPTDDVWRMHKVDGD